MYKLAATVVLLGSVVVVTGCSREPAPGTALDPVIAEQEVLAWRDRRLANLTSETGWLTLAGLVWLREGTHAFGSAPGTPLRLDWPGVPERLGEFTLQDGAVLFKPDTGAPVIRAEDGSVVDREMTLATDAGGSPTVLATGSLRFFVIERGDRHGVRVRDLEHPLRKEFPGLEYFPVRTDWIVEARFEPYLPPREMRIVNVLGMIEPMQSPGAIVFEHDGATYRLDTLVYTPEDKELFIMFADATTARETYGAGRYLYTPLPENGTVRVDFNRAYNPPCAFNDLATCPLPPAQNRLAVRVEAGEKKFPAAH